jgi:cell division septation protein DedD
MTVTCPQCQYENQAEAPSAASRVVCARCATLIPVSAQVFSNVSPLELDGPTPAPPNGYADASPLDFDSLFAPPVSAPPPSAAAPSNSWEFDEVLDIPRAAPAAPVGDPSLEIEEILGGPSRSSFTTTEMSAPPQAESRGDLLPTLPEVNGNRTDEPRVNPWAAQPEANSAPARTPLTFPQDSFQFAESTVVMTPPRRVKSSLAKMLLVAACLGALAVVGYFLLGDLVREWLSEPSQQQAANTAAGKTNQPPGAPTKPGPANPDAAKPANPGNAATGAPQTAPSQTPKLASSSVPAATAAPVKPTPQPTAQPTAQAKAAPPQQQPVGHSVSQSEGSLTVQVGSYPDLGRANDRVAKLKAAGVEARVVKAQVPGKGTWYRVHAGRFTSQADADRYRQELRAKGAAKDSLVAGYQAQ